MEIENNELMEVFSDPVRWAETFLRNPRDKEENLELRSYQSSVLAATRKYKNMILQQGRRCLPGYSPILMHDGKIKKIKDIEIGDYVVARDDNAQPKKRKVIDKFYNGIKTVYRIRLADGREIDCTDNHPILCWVPTSENSKIYHYKWVTIEDGLSKGYKVVSLKQWNNFGSLCNYDEAKLLGYLITDGHLGEDQTPKFTSKNKLYIDEVQLLVKSMFDYNCTVKKRNDSDCFDIHLTDGNKGTVNKVKSYLKELNLLGTKAKFDGIIKRLYEYDNITLGYFLNRMFAGDGCISLNIRKDRPNYGKAVDVNLTSHYIEFLKEIRSILYKIGVRSKLKMEVKKSPNSDKMCTNWKLTFSDSESIEKFFEFVGPIYGKEKQSFGALVEIKKRSKKVHKKGSVYYYKSSVKSIEYIGEMPTFDITVDKDHNFTVNGIVNHNSGKSVTMCALTLWWAAVYPMVEVLEGKSKKQKPQRIILATPYETQIKELWSIYVSLIADSPLLKTQVEKIRTSDIHTIEFSNGSKIEGYTIGISSSNKGTSLRSLSADILFIDEMDFIPREIMEEVIIPIATTHTECRIFICSTPSGKRELYWEYCFPKDTQVSTPLGLKNIQCIKSGDVVFTENGDIDTVVNTFRHIHNGLFYKFKTKISEFECTDEHPILSTSRLEIKPIYRKAKDVKIGHYLVHPIKQYPKVQLYYDINIFKTDIENERESIYNTYLDSSMNKTEFEKNTNTITRRTLQDYECKIKKYGKTWMFDNRIRVQIEKTNQILDKISNNEFNLFKLCRLIGYYLSEGTILKSKDYDSEYNRAFYRGIQFSFNSNEIDYINEVQELILDLFPETKITITNNPKDTCTMVLCYNQMLSYLFKILCGEYCDKKIIHPYLMSKPESFEILKTYINGDGWCIDKKNNEKILSDRFGFVTTSKQLSDDLFNIATKNKISISRNIRYKTDGKTAYVFIKLKEDYIFKDNYFLTRVKKITTRIGNEEVYNFETKNTHQYIVDNTLVHNCTRASELGWYHQHIPSWHPDNTNWMSIEQAKAKGIPITESTEFQVRAVTSSERFAREYGAEFGEELGGVYKHSFINKALVKYGRDINLEDTDEFNPNFPVNPDNLYVMGVDWNSYQNGGQIVIVEFCRAPTQIEFYDDSSGKDILVDFTNKFRLFYRKGVKSKGATQRQTREEIIRLVKTMKIDYIYADYGHGDTNIEELTFYGRSHKDLGLEKKLKAIDSGAVVEHWDPVLREKVHKRNKSLMVNFSALYLEEGKILLPKEEDQNTRLIGQIRGYTIKNITSRGDFTYTGEDHILDAFNLALYGFSKEFDPGLFTNKQTYTMMVLPDPRSQEYPRREVEHTGRRSNELGRQTRDPELPQNFQLPRRSNMPRIGMRGNINSYRRWNV